MSIPSVQADSVCLKTGGLLISIFIHSITQKSHLQISLGSALSASVSQKGSCGQDLILSDALVCKNEDL